MVDGAYRGIGGKWVPAEPVKQSRLFRLEMWLRRHGRKRISSLMARWDERKLGR